jgi:hypothetical protein
MADKSFVTKVRLARGELIRDWDAWVIFLDMEDAMFWEEIDPINDYERSWMFVRDLQPVVLYCRVTGRLPSCNC